MAKKNSGKLAGKMPMNQSQMGSMMGQNPQVAVSKASKPAKKRNK